MPVFNVSPPLQIARALWNAAYDALSDAHAPVHDTANRYGIPNIVGFAAQSLTTIGAAVAHVWGMRPDTGQMAANRTYINAGASVLQLMMDAAESLRNARQQQPPIPIAERLMRSGVAFGLFNAALHVMVRRTGTTHTDYNEMAYSDVAGLDLITFDILLQTVTLAAFHLMISSPLNFGLHQAGASQTALLQIATEQSAQALQPFAQHADTRQYDLQSMLDGWLHEEHAEDFVEFLRRLSTETINARAPDFKVKLVEWLERLNTDDVLRKDTFAAALTATASCEDRVTLAFNQMRGLCIAADVQRGDYDHRLPELLRLARGMYRLDVLEKIARTKVNELESMRRLLAFTVDPIEVHLAYQTGLRERLTLPLDATQMRFGGLSELTEKDLQDAANAILQREPTEFPTFLSRDWAPWQAVLRRMAPQTHETMQTELIESMDEPFTTQLNARLAAEGLSADSDAQRAIGRQVADEIAAEIMKRHTESFLRTRGLDWLKAVS